MGLDIFDFNDMQTLDMGGGKIASMSGFIGEKIVAPAESPEDQFHRRVMEALNG